MVVYELATVAIVGQNMKNVPGIAGKFLSRWGATGLASFLWRKEQARPISRA